MNSSLLHQIFKLLSRLIVIIYVRVKLYKPDNDKLLISKVYISLKVTSFKVVIEN